jgi:hypothetical protein
MNIFKAPPNVEAAKSKPSFNMEHNFLVKIRAPSKKFFAQFSIFQGENNVIQN